MPCTSSSGLPMLGCCGAGCQFQGAGWTLINGFDRTLQWAGVNAFFQSTLEAVDYGTYQFELQLLQAGQGDFQLFISYVDVPWSYIGMDQPIVAPHLCDGTPAGRFDYEWGWELTHFTLDGISRIYEPFVIPRCLTAWFWVWTGLGGAWEMRGILTPATCPP